MIWFNGNLLVLNSNALTLILGLHTNWNPLLRESGSLARYFLHLEEPFGKKSDIWSLGCIIYELAALKPPFRARDLDQLYRKVQLGIFMILLMSGAFDPLPRQYSKELRQLVALCLTVDPKRRPDTSHLLNHNFLKKYLK